MRPRCETVGCRGNRPCEACLAELSGALFRGVASVLATNPTSASNKLDPRGLELSRVVLAAVRRELEDKVWAKTTIGKLIKREEKKHALVEIEHPKERAPSRGRKRERV